MLELGTTMNMGTEGEGDIRDDYYMFDLNNWIDEKKGKTRRAYELTGSKLCNFKTLSEHVNEEAVGIIFGI